MDVAAYHPASLPDRDWGRIRPFVTAVVETAQEQYEGRYNTRDLLSALTGHVHWVTQVACLPLDVSTILHRDTIAEYIAHGCPSLTPGSRATRRSQLIRIAEAALPAEERVSRLQAVHRDNPARPYTPAEQIALRSWAVGQTTDQRREDCHTILALGLGAGLATTDMLALRVEDILVDNQGVLITVHGTRTREVPVLARWEKHLVTLTQTLPGDLWVLGTPRRKPNPNWMDAFLAKTQAEGSLRASPARLRNTWLVHHLTTGTPLGPLAHAAGLSTFRTIEKLLPFVPEPTRDDVRATMRHHKRSIQ